ncbi:MAG: ABC transporter permease [Gemmatimonadetes bacterium]|nr:ABC transporter permease [Gemmatimonadota bacterium]
MNHLSRFAPLLGLLAVYGLFAILGPDSFSSGRNLETIARQTAIVGTAALGMALVIIAGGIDLSVGSIIALTTVTIAASLQTDLSPPVAALIGILTGALCGLVNGLIITRFRVVPFIVTLGTLLLVRGIAKGLASEQKIDAPLTYLIDLLAALPQGAWWIFPPGVWLLIILALLTGGFLAYTRPGKHIVAIGSNENTARLCGIRVEATKLLVYTLAGTSAGIAGLLQFSRLTVGDPTVAVGLELDVIAAVVIGGGSLSGGEGSVLGSVVGALIMTVIRSGCSQMGLPNWVQEIVTGIIIVIAVAVDRLRHRER